MLIRIAQAVLVFSLLLVSALPTPEGKYGSSRNPNPISQSLAFASNAPAVSTPKQPVHPASLIDASAHDSALSKFLETDLSQNLIRHFCSMVVQRVTKEGSSESKELSNFIPWAERFLYSVPKSHTNTAVVMVALTYLERAVLPSHFSGKDPLKSVFLGAVILAVKYTRESSNGIGWAYYARTAEGTVSYHAETPKGTPKGTRDTVPQFFQRILNFFTKEREQASWTPKDITAVERHFLGYLNHQLSIDEAMLLKTFNALPEHCKRPSR